jgi:hypothetical protein
MDARMKWIQASRSIAIVLSAPPFPPAPVIHTSALSSSSTYLLMKTQTFYIPALQTTQSTFPTLSITFPASSTLFTSSILATNGSTFPGPFDPASRRAGIWSLLRMTEMTFQERARSFGVISKETLPWPPRRRILVIV